MSDDRPLCLLLLDGVLEDVPFGQRAQDLLRAPGVVAVEPARVSLRRGGDALAARQAQRLGKKLPGTPRVVVVLDTAQYPLARALLGRNADCELWYSPTGNEGELHDLALSRAALTFDATDHEGQPAFAQNADLWTRLEALGIARR